MNDQTIRLDEDGRKRAAALRLVRPLIDPNPRAYEQNRDEPAERLDGVDLAHVVQLAEYVLTGEHWSLDETDDEEGDDEAGDLSVVAQVLDLADELGFDLLPWQERLIEQAFADEGDDPAAPWGAARVRAVRRGDDVEQGENVPPEDDEPDHTGTGEAPRGDGTGPHLHVAEPAFRVEHRTGAPEPGLVDRILSASTCCPRGPHAHVEVFPTSDGGTVTKTCADGDATEPGDFALVHPLTHREPSRWSVLIDRQGDGWEYSDKLNGWTMNGSLTGVSWGPGLAWGPFTIVGAAPSVADDLAKWIPGVHPEPRKTAVLMAPNGSEWEFSEGSGRWVIVRRADGSAVDTGAAIKWDGPGLFGIGRQFTIRTEGTKR